MNPKLKTALIHSSLFILTLITTTIAGSGWAFEKFAMGFDFSINPEFTINDFVMGLSYSIPFLLILTVHEFGHYFTAIYHKVKTTLPYYLPLPPLPLSFGTLGAVIRIKSRIYSKKQNFDIGIAGPLAGFVVAIGVLIYGFATLPPPEFIYQFHPEYKQYGADYAQYVYSAQEMAGKVDVVVGRNLLFMFFEKFVGDPARVPNVHEIMHYPVLLAGFLSLVFTSLNLLPFGQLDGGHVLYGLVGYKRHRIIASVLFVGFLFYAVLGFLRPGEELEIFGLQIPHLPSVALITAGIYYILRGLHISTVNRVTLAISIFAVQYAVVWFFPTVVGYRGWLVFAFIIGRFVQVTHPPTEIEEPLSTGRKILGWLALVIFVICFTPDPISLIISQ